ncbi:tyrosine-type recombinase/integrase [Citrobacter braakii]|nr:tyrosine-type recombinase/integrase [Citrobacter braakii]
MNSQPVTRRFADNDLHQQLSTVKVNDKQLMRLIRYFSHLKYHTAKTYLHWLRSWNEWYQANAGKEVNEDWPASSLPVTETPLLAYLDHLQKSLSRSSIKGCLHALNSIQRKALDQPGIITSEVGYILAALEQAEARKQKVTRQATPFMVTDLKALIKAHSTTQSVRKLRDLCLIWTGFETLLRSAEIRRIRMEDLVLDEKTGGFTLTVYRTKSTVSTLLTYHLTPNLTATLRRLMGMVGRDQYSHPKDYLFQAVNFQDNGYMPPEWGLRSQGNEINALLRNHNMPYLPTRTPLGGNGEPIPVEDEGMLSKNTLLRAFEALWEELHPQETGTRCWTGHSVRVGGAIELAHAGYTLLQIMEMGNWSNAEMVSRYIRNIEAGKKAMTQFMRGALDE